MSENASDLGSLKWDELPYKNDFSVSGPNQRGMVAGKFIAFNTHIMLGAFAEKSVCTELFNDARALCHVYERLFSKTLPNSDTSRINTSAGEETEVAFDTFHLLQAALDYCKNSSGSFDVTIDSVMRLWDFREGVVPDEKDIAEALRHVGWKGVSLRKTSGSESERFYVRLDDPLSSLDLGGIAKGYIADGIADFLSQRGLDSFVINLGGNVVTKGEKPNGVPWRIGLRDPKNETGVIQMIGIQDMSIVTSGVYERGFDKNGKHYHHILNPTTGYPVETDIASASIVSEKSIDAEGYSTTVLSLGSKRGLEFAKATEAIRSAYLIDKDGNVLSV